jgi:succinate dehydrogenase/fumarate reductase cytochrome b subunit
MEPIESTTWDRFRWAAIGLAHRSSLIYIFVVVAMLLWQTATITLVVVKPPSPSTMADLLINGIIMIVTLALLYGAVVFHVLRKSNDAVSDAMWDLRNRNRADLWRIAADAVEMHEAETGGMSLALDMLRKHVMTAFIDSAPPTPTTSQNRMDRARDRGRTEQQAPV